MNKSNDIMSPFEKQLTQSAKRLREEQDNQLPLRKLPRRRNSATAWIATVAAACVGWLVGMTYPIGEERSANDLAVCVKPDTVIQYKEIVVHDTIIQKVVTPVQREVALEQKKNVEYGVDVQGCNVECDGIDYAMLIGM